MKARASVTTSFLGDELGPRGRRRVVAASVVSVAAIAAVLGVAANRLADKGQFADQLWRPLRQWSVLKFLLSGLVLTLKAAAVAMAIAMAIGLVMALGRLARNRLIRWVSGVYVEFFRAMPLILLITFCFFGLPAQGVDISPFQALVLGLSVYNGAVLGEIFRAGVLSLDRGQIEAASALGLTYWKSMGAVILPQAARRMAPAIVSQLVTLLKDTSLGFVVNVDDALRRARDTGTFYGNHLQAFALMAVCYIVINLALSRLANYLEVRQQRRLGAQRIDVGGVEDLAVVGAQASTQV
jgi:glutamate transport system permease protein